MVIGALAVGIVIGVILSWIINTLMRSTMTDSATRSRQKEYDVEIKRLKAENERLIGRLESES